MLLAVEGGGFFSSSASGYSHGLALLLLGRNGEDKCDKTSPCTCSHHRLVCQEAKHDCQVPSGKTDVPGKFASFICFGCTSARLVRASPPKLSSSSTSGTSSEQPSNSTNGASTTNGSSSNESGIKGCLKNNPHRDSSSRSIASFPRESLEEVQTLKSGMERRKVQWTDSCGKELSEIREFEVSDDGLSEDDKGNEGFRKCECVIQ